VGGKESKGLRAREENQRRVEKMERQREKKRKFSVMLSCHTIMKPHPIPIPNPNLLTNHIPSYAMTA
jgi:hypothetical protein